MKPQNPRIAPVRMQAAVPLARDPLVGFSLANPYGIQFGPPTAVDQLAGTWWSGHVNDVLVLTQPSSFAGALIVGSDSGGVWIVYPLKPGMPQRSQCLSDDWDVPGVLCLCQGPGGAEHIFAGTADVLRGFQTGYVYETMASYGFVKWRPIPDVSGNARNFQSVFRMAVVDGGTTQNRLVLATQAGVFWANIPNPGENYVWQQVTAMSNGTNFPAGAYSGLCIGPNGRVVVAAYGVDPSGLYGIFYGDWSSETLTMTRAAMPPGNSGKTFDQGMYRTSLSSSSIDPLQMYAVSAASDGSIFCVLRSSDGGKTWTKPYDPSGTNASAAPTVFARSNPNVSGSLFANARFQGWYNNCIAVSPTDGAGNTVALGWQAGAYLSKDGGKTWELMVGPGPGLHSDVHGLYFDPADATGQTLYIASDGGVAVTRDGGASFDTSMNKYLAQMQFYSTTALRDFYGTMSLLGPIVAAGSQDNGNLYCILEGTYSTGVGSVQNFPSPWVKFSGCDGGPVNLLPVARVLSGAVCGGNGTNTWIQSTPNSSNIFALDPGGALLVSDPAHGDDGQGIIASTSDVRIAPAFTNSQGQSMYAIAFSALAVYGVFGNHDGTALHFEHIGAVASDVLNDTISAAGTLDGTAVFIGTSAGRMFKLVPQQGRNPTAQRLSLNLPPGTPQGAVNRIVAVSGSEAYATYNFGWYGHILRFDGTSWQISDAGLPGDAYQGLEVDDVGSMVFAATAAQVFVSRDNGATWSDGSAGLPKQAHCSDLRFIRVDPALGHLFLSTFGRSLWRCDIPGIELVVEPTSVISGSQNATGTVIAHTPVPAAGLQVTLTSDFSEFAAVPNNVTVPSGSRSVTFTVQTKPVATNIDNNISAAALNTAANAHLTLLPQPGPTAALSLRISPDLIVQGSTAIGKITIAKATAQPLTVVLTSSSAVATVPPTVIIPAGQATTSFVINSITLPGAVRLKVIVITAAAGGVTTDAILVVQRALPPNGGNGGGPRKI